MKPLREFKRLTGQLALLVVLVAGFVVACDPVDPASQASSQCGSGSAAIGLADGMVAILCGCDEAGGQWVGNASGLTCTVPIGTIVMFHNFSPSRPHQLVAASGATPAIAAGPVLDPRGDLAIRAHAVAPDQVATYAITDAYDSTLALSIVGR